MSDISLLMAGVLTTGQPSLPILPPEPTTQGEQIVDEKVDSPQISSSDKIAPPEFTLEENNSERITSELTQQQKNILNKTRVKDKGEAESPKGQIKNLSPAKSINASLDSPTSPSTPEFTFPDTVEATSGMSQVTSVSQLNDVLPSDWAFTALQSLVERYGCIAGYPNGNFKGNRAITRYEFAAGLSSCMDKISELIAVGKENLASKEDLVILQRLQTEFQAELKEVTARVNNLEQRSAQVEANQFSATTKLYGQATFSVQGTNETDIFLYRGEEQPRKAKTNTTLTANTQLTLATSFTGRDLLLTGLSAGNLKPSTQSVSTNMGRLGFESDTGENLYLGELSYRFPVSDNLGVVVGTAGVNPVNTFRGINPLEGSGDGAISLFGQRNPILAIGSGTSGIGFDWQISDRISLQGVYSSQIASFPGDIEIGGLFGGSYTAGAQLTLVPTQNIDVGIHYLFNHSPDGNLRTGIGDTQLTSPLVGTDTFDTHAVGATVAWRVNPNLQLGGWGGWTTSNPVNLSGSVETTNWAVFAALPNLFRPGNLGGILVGQPPKITSSTLPDGYNLPNFAVPDFDTGGGKGGREDTSLHLEMFYRAQLNDNIALTPGLFVIFNPNHNADSNALIVGALRATFRF
ncbi:carbohydrate-selective porin OprB [Calothrix sp. NIES-4071]|nr:carbohydrate-selective porin OprB [Calothrix sp. NIES-4071]BAZ58472.1 carbohydrate-selective porin OprB [Calothrix sp. NIES-4105]